MTRARIGKNDEFYTQITDIEKEILHYKDQLKDKIIFCNCDDPEWSNFWKYFYTNFEHLELKKLISTHYESDKTSYKLECYKNEEGILTVNKLPLEMNGDFRSPESIELLKECDIVITNPPFSLFREYVSQLITYEKKFLIIGNYNAVTYKETFPLIKDNKIWLGMNYPKEFTQPDGSIKKFGNIAWFTNLPNKKRNEELILYKNYTPEYYPFYDNYSAINVNKVNEIPCDYSEEIGVPITFIDKFNPNQFEIIGLDVNLVKELTGKGSRFITNGNILYARIIIKKLEGNN